MKNLFYYSQACPYCQMADKLLIKKNIKVERLDVDKNPKLWDDIYKANRNTVPHIIINNVLVGGYDDLVELDIKGKLQEIINNVK